MGVDLIAGSLIKNPGGGIARTGGYIVGRKDLVEACAYRLTAPGLGREAGANLDTLLEMYQGFFLAPHVVGQAVKGGICGGIAATIGLDDNPAWDDVRTDIFNP